MIVDDFRRTIESGSYGVSARIRHQGDAEQFRLFYRFPEEFAPAGDVDASPCPRSGVASAPFGTPQDRRSGFASPPRGVDS